MYALSNIDFSARLGCVVSEVTPDEIDGQEQALGSIRGSEPVEPIKVNQTK